MKTLHKMVTPAPPRTAFMKSLFRHLTVFLSTYINTVKFFLFIYVFLNKRYEILPQILFSVLKCTPPLNPAAHCFDNPSRLFLLGW